jgi:hypothetical protein
MYDKKHLPPGGKGNYFKLWYQMHFNQLYVETKIGRIIRVFPGGEQIVRMLRKMNNKVRRM